MKKKSSYSESPSSKSKLAEVEPARTNCQSNHRRRQRNKDPWGLHDGNDGMCSLSKGKKHKEKCNSPDLLFWMIWIGWCGKLRGFIGRFHHRTWTHKRSPIGNKLSKALRV